MGILEAAGYMKQATFGYKIVVQLSALQSEQPGLGYTGTQRALGLLQTQQTHQVEQAQHSMWQVQHI